MKQIILKPQKSINSGQMASGMLVAWIAQFVQIVSGFMVPRWIDHGLGREMLGVWDFGWSLVSYLTLLQAGIGSSVNRHVALHSAQGDVDGINKIVSSVSLFQRAVGILILVLTGILALTLPSYLKDLSPAQITDARWMVTILGSSVALTLAGAIYTGIMTGLQRWAAHHSIYCATNILLVMGMYGVIKSGFGIVALASVHLGTELLGRILRVIFAYRSCQGLSITFKNADSATIKRMMSFGGRMFIGRMSQVVLNQTLNIIIAAHLGPAALALFSRPRALVRQVSVFPQKYAFMLVPAAAAVCDGNPDHLRTFVMNSTRLGVYMVLPLMAFLACSGDLLLQLWMGPQYSSPILIVLLTLAFMCEVAMHPLNCILLGLDYHGRPGVYSLVAAFCAIGLALLTLLGGGGLTLVAVAVGIPWSFVHGLCLPAYACRRLNMQLGPFLKHVWTGPLLTSIPFSFCLLAANWAWPEQNLVALLVGTGTGGTLLICCYWRRVWSPEFKSQITRLLSCFRLGRSPFSQKLKEDATPSASLPVSDSTP